ncbi:MAG: hypothetical protein ACUVTD_06385 [Nitrososphaerales archaeon]
MNDYGIGISYGYINTEGTIYCEKKNRELRLRVEMDSKSAIDQIGKI